MSTFGTNDYGQNIYGGPAVLSETLSETGSASDNFSGPAAFAGDLSEAGSASNVEAATANFVAGLSVSEVGSATDAETALAIFVGIVDESGDATDATDATTSYALQGVECVAQVGTSNKTTSYSLQGVECVAEAAGATATNGYGEDLYGLGPYSAPALVELLVPLTGVSATAQLGTSAEAIVYLLRGVECAAEAATATSTYGSGRYGLGPYSVPTLEVELLVPLTGVSATAQVRSVSHAGLPGPRTFFIGSTIQKVIAPGIMMLPTSENLQPVPTSRYGVGTYSTGFYGHARAVYVIGSSQFYTIGAVYWNGAVRTQGVDWEFVSPFTHIIRILANSFATPVTLLYYQWNIQVTQGFQVTSYPVPFSFTNTTIVADAMPPIDKYFTVNFIGNRIANNPQTLFSIFPLMVDDMLENHLQYDGSNGFQTYRPDCYQVLDTTLMKIFEWNGSRWIAICDVPSGASFYVKTLRQVWENQAGTAVLKYTAGDGVSDSYPQAITYPAFGEGVGKNLLADGFSAEAPTEYPAAYQICQSPGPYDSVCQDEGFDRDFDFSFS